MIIVIGYTIEKDVYDRNGRLVERKGDRFVSHGIDTTTLETVILPNEPFGPFVTAYCWFNPKLGEYIL